MVWPTWGTRAVAAGGSVLAGAVAGIATNVVTDRPSLPWLVSLAVSVVLAVALQMWLTMTDSRQTEPPLGAGAVGVAGSSYASISTDVAGARRLSGPGHGSGAGSVSVGGDSRGPIRTRVRDVEER